MTAHTFAPASPVLTDHHRGRRPTRLAPGVLAALFALGFCLLGRAASAQNKPAPPGNTPAGNTPAAPAAPAAGKTFVVKLPPGGKYVLSIPEAGKAPVQVAGETATLEAPPGLEKFTLSVVDEQSGYAARRELTVKNLPAEVTLTPTDLNLVHVVKVRVTGKDDKPVANAAVILTDSQKKVHQLAIDAPRQGEVLIGDVAQGKASLTIAPASGSPTTKEVEIAIPKGDTSQAILVPLPEVTAVLDVPPANTPAAAPGNIPVSTAPAPPPDTARSEPSRDRPSEPGGGSYFFQTILSFAILAGIGYGLYVVGKKQGWTIEGAMQKLGAGSQTVAGPTGTPGPGPAPTPAPPPPVVADPNRCQFCGELKDPATGACACAIGAAPPGAPVPAGAFGAPGIPSSGGPRLIAAAGLYMGEIYPLLGDTVVGRDPGCSIPLDRDTTVSRRHARLSPEGGSYRLVDEGSSNGVYVNGARVTDALLHPGDEVSIGNTRFRFEV